MSIESSGLKLLGEGPVATVYSGWVNGSEVAVKVFPGGFDRETATTLARERKALGTVRSPRSVLAVDEVIEAPEGQSAVRMELCRGSVAGLLGKPMPAAYALAVGWTVATALAGAHEAGVVHGGVTPHNVLYRASGELVVSDFGQALRRRFPPDPMHAVEYAAPEKLRDDTLSEAADLYGLGAVLYAALTGAPPFPKRTGRLPGERILQVLRDPVPALAVPGVPSGLSEMVSQLLAKDPADRPQDAAAVARTLGRMYRMVTGAGSREEVEFDDFAGQAVAGSAGPGAAAGPGQQPWPVWPGRPWSGHAMRSWPAQHPRQTVPAQPVRSARSVDPTEPVPPEQPAQPRQSVQPAQQIPAQPSRSTEPMPPTAPIPAVATTTAPIITPTPATAPSGRTLVYSVGGTESSTKDKHARTGRRPAILVGLGAAIAGLIVVPIILTQNDSSGGPGVPAAAMPQAPVSSWPGPASTTPADAHLVLAPPTDLGTRIQLNWTADGDLDFTVVVAGERLDPMTLVANRRHTMTVNVDPARGYCFQIRATDGAHIYTTDPVPIRGSRCNP
ncbi:serine/threonine-protein kinase [Amycolatopsis pigmentata]|uniref:non-specific serine/threonine protein kinase n=1 Tax=Amycolatopsis pigmentata TaxID=450801 RepID=A0ABW5FL71_9PSEU